MIDGRVQLPIPEKLIPVFHGKADVRGAYGGRGSAKTRTFAIMSAVKAVQFASAGRSGIILCARQFQNTLDESSMEEVKQAIHDIDWLNQYFDIGENYIRTRNLLGQVDYAFMGLQRNINSVKSKARILLCWVDEAEYVIERAWVILIPTIREDDSELWITWNPERKGSPVDIRWRNSDDPLVKVVEMNWRDNPKFPEKLQRERQRDKKSNPEQYEHIWEGGYATAHKGAYYAESLLKAKEEGRICKAAPDPHMTIRLYTDIGGTGARADNFVFWVAQFIGREIRVVNHYEVQGQPIGHHLEWLRDQEYIPRKAQIWLPHDGETNDQVYDVSYQSAFEKAGYKVTIIPNQGTGAASKRVEFSRKAFPNVWFNESTTENGRIALGYYHEKIDENRGAGLGPEHDWSSHSADAFGAMCVDYEKFIKDTTRNWGEALYVKPDII